MGCKILSVSEISDSIKNECKRQVDLLKNSGIVPEVAAIMVGECPTVARQIGDHCRLCEEIGVKFIAYTFGFNADLKAINDRIMKISSSPDITGAVIYRSYDCIHSLVKIVSKLHLSKDIMAVSQKAVGRYVSFENEHLLPPFASALMAAFESNEIDLYDKDILLWGDYDLFCMPLVNILMKKHANISICSSISNPASEKMKLADIFIVKTTEKQCISAKNIKENALLVDMSGFALDDESFSGGGIFTDDVEDVAGKILPAGSILPLENSMFLNNVIELARRQTISGGQSSPSGIKKIKPDRKR
jgi:methylenetetrahydrofolate dehydrogenase (NADP+)/methenyltetrahydrofolate cyclohydrolase